ncbi:3-deoxy-D-manno-octulosonic acid transferase [Desulfohalobium retbaense]|uniref:3-deoxy-D-manno-octulosonic acid transferase n=1 Tax=Desulfohalobium retbaense (strain ATCC 49708 / DSM 5692 / JCM 16813 / HR100) TaxID=485915 RepID=C8X238_DESRD|nr:glycosyltransferase N-terminal domain-containing protein [Desulfohalobium retbaense]ACV68361.1 Three-deoxy-D-manno-octulosonic-acid transferase domain protein [Desulfohalobium retbaense DSM 5692]
MRDEAKRSTAWMIGYSILWFVALPFLALHRRLRCGWRQRLLLRAPRIRADVWIQAASVGEARLAQTLVSDLAPEQPLHILVTSCTKEGREILDSTQVPGPVVLHTAYFPFDLPLLMAKALERWRPRCVLLLETELWPGLLSQCRRKAIPAHIVNARMGRRTLPQYLALQKLWQSAAPAAVHPISDTDARRYATVFGSIASRTMSNIKFDTCLPANPLPFVHNPLARYFKAQSQLLVLGSLRREEEEDIELLLREVLEKRPRALIALFPRHLQRVGPWQGRLDSLGLPWILRSEMTEPPSPGTVIVWDRLGELEAAYALARAVFVGGSLAPLGGQNFLEALGQGVTPVIGPFWDNFSWVGSEICQTGLVFCATSRQEVTTEILQNMKRPPQREKIYARFKNYIVSRQGGTAYAQQLLLEMTTPATDTTKG